MAPSGRPGLGTVVAVAAVVVVGLFLVGRVIAFLSGLVSLVATGIVVGLVVWAVLTVLSVRRR
jgi:hypothetical protein